MLKCLSLRNSFYHLRLISTKNIGCCVSIQCEPPPSLPLHNIPARQRLRSLATRSLPPHLTRVINSQLKRLQIALETTRRLADEAKRELDRAFHEAEQIVDNVTAKVRNTADEIKHDLEAAVPSFDGKLQEIIKDITEASSNAADEGVDITESINGAVEIVFI